MGDRDAGRELDRLIARKVMGWVVFEANREIRFTDPTNAMMSRRVPDFSTDMAATMAVVGEMASPGFAVKMIARGSGDFYVEWRCDDLVIAEEEADSLPLAICLAALATAPRETVQGDANG